MTASMLPRLENPVETADSQVSSESAPANTTSGADPVSLDQLAHEIYVRFDIGNTSAQRRELFICRGRL
jgi:hypothetical protein